MAILKMSMKPPIRSSLRRLWMAILAHMIPTQHYINIEAVIWTAFLVKRGKCYPNISFPKHIHFFPFVLGIVDWGFFIATFFILRDSANYNTKFSDHFRKKKLKKSLDCLKERALLGKY